MPSYSYSSPPSGQYQQPGGQYNPPSGQYQQYSPPSGQYQQYSPPSDHKPTGGYQQGGQYSPPGAQYGYGQQTPYGGQYGQPGGQYGQYGQSGGQYGQYGQSGGQYSQYGDKYGKNGGQDDDDDDDGPDNDGPKDRDDDDGKPNTKSDGPDDDDDDGPDDDGPKDRGDDDGKPNPKSDGPDDDDDDDGPKDRGDDDGNPDTKSDGRNNGPDDDDDDMPDDFLQKLDKYSHLPPGTPNPICEIDQICMKKDRPSEGIDSKKDPRMYIACRDPADNSLFCPWDNCYISKPMVTCVAPYGEPQGRRRLLSVDGDHTMMRRLLADNSNGAGADLIRSGINMSFGALLLGVLFGGKGVVAQAAIMACLLSAFMLMFMGN